MDGIERKRHIGFYGGSFNPVHTGHLILADYMAQFAGLDEVWLSVSPLNPLKAGEERPVDDDDRLAMLRLAIGDNPLLKISTIELSMPLPTYTINTLREISRLHPDAKFSLIIGSDNWKLFDRWKFPEEIIERFSPIIYPRPGYEVDARTLPQGVRLLEKAPLLDISSTFIRQAIASGHNMEYFVTSRVWNYIVKHSLYMK